MSKEASENSLDLLKTCQANGWMKIENPEKLSAQLTARYGDKAPDLIMEAVNNPSGLMKKIGQEPTTPTNTLNYLVSDDISKDNIAKLGGTIEQASTGFKLEPLSQTEEVQTFNTNPTQTQESTPQQASPDLSQIGNVDVYGKQVQSQDQSGSSSSSSSDTDNYQTDSQDTQQYSDPWSEFFSSFLSGDLGKMLGEAIKIQLLNQAHLAFAPHYCPFPHHCHPLHDRIDHFDHYVDNRSKTEKVLDKVAHATHDIAHITHDTVHITHNIERIFGKGGRRC